MTPLPGLHYLAGPMSGFPAFNFPAFTAAARRLRASGWQILNPVEMDENDVHGAAMDSQDGDMDALVERTGVTYGETLARDLAVLADDAVGIILLPGWENSKGARIEAMLAYGLGKRILEFNDGHPYEAKWIRATFASATSTIRMSRSNITGVRERMENAADEQVGAAVSEAARAGLQAALRREKGYSAASFDDPDFLASPAVRTRLDELLAVRDLTPLAVPAPLGETRVTNPTTGGEKGTKPEKFEYLPPEALAEVARVYGMGATKYSPWNWRRGYVWSLSYGAAQRHLAAFWGGEDKDPESGLHHAAHAVFHMLALITFAAEHPELDDRFKDAP